MKKSKKDSTLVTAFVLYLIFNSTRLHCFISLLSDDIHSAPYLHLHILVLGRSQHFLLMDGVPLQPGFIEDGLIVTKHCKRQLFFKLLPAALQCPRHRRRCQAPRCRCAAVAAAKIPAGEEVAMLGRSFLSTCYSYIFACHPAFA